MFNYFKPKQKEILYIDVHCVIYSMMTDIEKINYLIFLHNFYTKKFIINKMNVNFNKICKLKIFNDDFLILYKKYINWKLISKYHDLNDNFIEKFHKKINWKIISQKRITKYAFVCKYKKYINYTSLLNYNSHFILYNTTITPKLLLICSKYMTNKEKKLFKEYVY